MYYLTHTIDDGGAIKQLIVEYLYPQLAYIPSAFELQINNVVI